MSPSELIDSYIFHSIGCQYDDKEMSSAYKKLIGFGELVDRLTIVNIKLYNLKNEVMRRQSDEKFLASAAIKDIALVEERSRLKKCIDQYLASYHSVPMTQNEIKSYGKDFND